MQFCGNWVSEFSGWKERSRESCVAEKRMADAERRREMERVRATRKIIAREKKREGQRDREREEGNGRLRKAEQAREKRRAKPGFLDQGLDGCRCRQWRG